VIASLKLWQTGTHGSLVPRVSMFFVFVSLKAFFNTRR